MTHISKIQEWTDPDALTRIEGWAREGLTEEQIAGNMGISRSTLKLWKKKELTISAALKKGKAPVDQAVENAMLTAALGHFETVRKAVKLKTRQIVDGQIIETEHVEYVEETIYIPPNVTAQIFWLKNRRPARWRDKIDYDCGYSGPPVFINGHVSDEGLHDIYEQYKPVVVFSGYNDIQD